MISASQVNVFRECPRKWAWKYIAKLEEPKTDAQALGDAVEGQLQAYLIEGKPLDTDQVAGAIAQTALPYLPQPKTSALVLQKHFAIPSPSCASRETGYGFQGYLDLWCDGRVTDFKTTKDLKWAKTPEVLASDVQATTYAFAEYYDRHARGLRGSEATAPLELQWITMRTRGKPKAVESPLLVTRDEIVRKFKAIDDTAAEINRCREEVKDPLELEPNPSACQAYGGCPFQSRCNLSPAQILDGLARKSERDAASVFGSINNVPEERDNMTTTYTAEADGSVEADAQDASAENASVILLAKLRARKGGSGEVAVARASERGPRALATAPISQAVKASGINPPESKDVTPSDASREVVAQVEAVIAEVKAAPPKERKTRNSKAKQTESTIKGPGFDLVCVDEASKDAAPGDGETFDPNRKLVAALRSACLAFLAASEGV